MRDDGRNIDQIRPLAFEGGFVSSANGSCLISCGRTRVLCTAMVEESVPGWMQGRGTGWITAEYAMLPGSTGSRKARDGRKGGHVDGRIVEIQRLVGRALRPTVDLGRLGERTVFLDCDVLEADGGTRTTAINGASVALRQAVDALLADGSLAGDPIVSEVAAVSVGIVQGQPVLDMAYSEDHDAEADLNIVMTRAGDLVEVQGTGEKRGFTRAELDVALDLATQGIAEIFAARDALRGDA